MPSYTFRNTKTEEVFTESMKIAEMEDYLQKNPHIVHVFGQINVVDPIGIGVKRPPEDFQKGILGKIKEIPGIEKSTIEKRWNISREW